MNRAYLDRLLSWVGVVLTLVLLAGGVLALIGRNYADSQVQHQLVQEKVTFPPKGSPGLDPKEFPGLQKYAGQPVDTGTKAEAYADQFIWVHMMSASGGKTYAEVANEAQANPNDPKLQGLKQTLFQGDMLRSSLLTAYAFSRFGLVALWAAIALFAGAVLMAILTVLGFLHASRVAREPVPQR